MGTSQTIHDILDQFRDAARSNRDLGDRFERLFLRYLQLDPLYADLYSDVWMWNDFPLKGNVGDVGIDLVAQERATGNYCAIQCKFYLPEHTLSKADIDSFFTAAGKDTFSTCMIVSTTDKWGKNAEDALKNQSKPVQRIRVQDLDASPVDWGRFRIDLPSDLSLRPKKIPREHQCIAIESVRKGFESSDRGKLIMACGTGKTFTSLCFAESFAPGGRVLFLVPSLALLAQSLREWTAESRSPIHCLAVCSDANIGKRQTKGDDDNTDITTYDLPFPATTLASEILKQYVALNDGKQESNVGMSVVFSTYQSLTAVAEAQRLGLPDFDLIICDEAHRTTGVTFPGEDESSFVRVHDGNYIKAAKRLYMTATPRIYSDDTKIKAKESEVAICSMDDPVVFGPEFHRLGFGEAVSKGLLSDYKVLVLAVDQAYVSSVFQAQLTDENNELHLDDAVKITGCWNGLQKRLHDADLTEDPRPMLRGVAFARSIKDSKSFAVKFEQLINAYQQTHPEETNLLQCQTKHVDGTFGAMQRGELLDWLKGDAPANTCRILSNAKCLSEGVDVPALDAVLFLNPRKSIIDVVQSVGRVMRKAEDKKYGYIILPIGIPANMEPEEALRDHDKYKVVWQVLQALRAHDDRFNATVNQLELNKKRPSNIQVIGVGGQETGEGDARSTEPKDSGTPSQTKFDFPNLEEWKDAIYARIVQKCGDRRYWESWAKDVAVIAERHTDRIRTLVREGSPEHRAIFGDFLAGLRSNLNPSVTEDDAIEMLSQHLITRPVFDALFANYQFTDLNPVSVSMQRALDVLEGQALSKETERLEKFYASVRERASGIDNAEGRQRVVVELYDKFFRTAFPRVAERLGIVYTPVEVVDFIIRSVEDVLRDEFGKSISDRNVQVIDPFTGTGTFVVRLLQSGLIKSEDLLYKYQNELHANELVLLAYYVAAINIEEAFHGIHDQQAPEYQPFQGIVLTDTFQMNETDGTIDEYALPENNQRVARQKSSPITVVMGNPPYSAQQESEDDNNKNLKYPRLDARIRGTYAERSNSQLVKNLYDSYIRAIRWASDRIETRGVVAFVTNGSFLDSNNMDGLRACLADEFDSLYVFNLRGNARTQGEERRKEKGNVFGEGTRTPVAISILVRNPASTSRGIFYSEIGDYLDRSQKLAELKQLASVEGLRRLNKWHLVTPNASHDWINQRDPSFGTFPPLGDKKAGEISYFRNYSLGLVTNRDAWMINSSSLALQSNVRRSIETYERERLRYARACGELLKREFPEVESIISTLPTEISWTHNLKEDLRRGKALDFEPTVRTMAYRPFQKQNLYFSRRLNERVYQIPALFPTSSHENVVIMTTGVGASRPFSALITDAIPNLHMHDTGQCFPLYLYESAEMAPESLFDRSQSGDLVDGYYRTNALSDEIADAFRSTYGREVDKEDIFYYVYGVLHAPEYRRRFESDLKKMLPRVPIVEHLEDFSNFSRAGRELAALHLNYESVEPWPVTEECADLLLDDTADFLVQKMQFGRANRDVDKTTIHYNSKITLRGIPLEAYEYIVNGKSAIDWVMERYQITVDKDSGIRNDPNDWAREQGQPRYILDLLKRIVRVSLETNRIVKTLPTLR